MTVDEMQVGFMPKRGTIDAVLIMKRQDYTKKKEICFIDQQKALNRVPREVLQWAMRRKGIPEVMVRSVTSLYEGVKTRFKVDSKLSEYLKVVGMHQGSVLSPFCFAVVVDVVTEWVRKDMLSELLHADDLVLMSETIKGQKMSNG